MDVLPLGPGRMKAHLLLLIALEEFLPNCPKFLKAGQPQAQPGRPKMAAGLLPQGTGPMHWARGRMVPRV